MSWSQLLACEVLLPGDLAVDLTAGKGRDTCRLARAIGPAGQVVAFDLQASALEQAAALLRNHDLVVICWPGDRALPKQSGVVLVQA
ncbi:MAG: methyltransferase domain-containing protein, partial [Desulfuromonadales bacterium]